MSEFWLKKGGTRFQGFHFFQLYIYMQPACLNYLRHVVVVKLVIAESHIHVQGEVLSGQDDTMFSKELVVL